MAETEYLFFIDAGHGPNTEGKRSPDGTLREFNFNNPTAQKLFAKLTAYKNVTCILTYAQTTDTPLEDRTDLANDAYIKNLAKIKAGTLKVAFISIHANATGNGAEWIESAQGIETFVYSTRPAASVKLATNVQNGLISYTKRKDRGVKAADLHIVRETKMDAILVECGFMTSKEENALLKTAAYQDKCAAGIAAGIVKTYGLIKKPTTAAPAPATKPAAAKPGTLYKVQAGAFSTKAAAQKEADRIAKAANVKTIVISE